MRRGGHRALLTNSLLQPYQLHMVANLPSYPSLGFRRDYSTAHGSTDRSQRRSHGFPHLHARDPPRFSSRHSSQPLSSIARSKQNCILDTALIDRAASLRADEPYRLPASETTCAHPLSSTEPHNNRETTISSNHCVHSGRLD